MKVSTASLYFYYLLLSIGIGQNFRFSITIGGQRKRFHKQYCHLKLITDLHPKDHEHCYYMYLDNLKKQNTNGVDNLKKQNTNGENILLCIFSF